MLLRGAALCKNQLPAQCTLSAFDLMFKGYFHSHHFDAVGGNCPVKQC